MTEKNIDRRVRKTKTLLTNGLIELLKTKAANEISVRELSELVDINRGTFYLHYKDIFDMVDRLEEDLLYKFRKGIEDIPRKKGNQLPIMRYIFSFVYEHRSICEILLFDNSKATFVNKILDTLHMRNDENWSEINNVSMRQEFMYIDTFIEAGVLGIVKRWLENGMVESVEEMAKPTGDLIIQIIKKLY